VLLVLAGLFYGRDFDHTAAPQHTFAKQWPASTQCTLDSVKPTLLMFIHPKCPCSGASLIELADLKRRIGDRVQIQLVYLQPAGAPWECEETKHWVFGRELDPDSPFKDVAGEEHHRFGATTSGEVFVFLPDARLAFHGGITPARGHVGENAGSQAIESLVLHSKSAWRESAVFGCPLEASCQSSTCQSPLAVSR
jgi:hypothetical protein